MHAHRRSPDPHEINRLLARRDFLEALRLCRQWVQREPKSAYAWSGLTRASFALGFHGEARKAAARLLALAPGDSATEYLLSISEHHTGHTASAVQRLRRLSAAGTAIAEEASFALAEVLEQAGQHDELKEHIERGGEWLKADRSATFEAWLLAQVDRPAALALLQRVARSGSSPGVRRTAGFAAVQMLDEDGRYREAFDLARAVHADSAGSFDLGPLQARIDAQRRAIDRMRPVRSDDSAATAGGAGAKRVAFMLSLPRSGTTLVEQMLDRHPLLSGIGEYEGAVRMRRGVEALGIEVGALDRLLPADASRLRREYFTEAESRARADARWMLDKTLHTWTSLPWLSAVLPDARYVQVERDPRDRAISMYLSNFHPTNWAFTSSLESIRTFTALARSLVPHAVERLSLPVVRVQYERLVADPEGEIRHVLDHLGLAFDPAVLEPESNRRTILTLSAQQVRRKINSTSIGRWRNYAFAFGPEWDDMAPR